MADNERGSHRNASAFDFAEAPAEFLQHFADVLEKELKEITFIA